MTKQLFKKTFQLKETQCTIITDRQEAIAVAVGSIKRNRKALEDYLRHNPAFLYSLKPVAIPSKPTVARLMAEAAEKANVGPMAAVAGVIADLAVKDMVTSGCKVAVVEDGGEVSAVSETAIDVALAAGNTSLSKRFGFRLTNFPIGVATSSGRFSHALSFGHADAATTFCTNAALADAAATAVCNVVKGENASVALEEGIEIAKSIRGVRGVLILYNGHVGMWGEIPQIIKVAP